jgi:hypothetical protein
MKKTYKSNEQSRRVMVLSVYKRLLDEGKIKTEGAADKRYNELLRRRVK